MSMAELGSRPTIHGVSETFQNLLVLSSAYPTGFEMVVCVPKSSCEIVMPGGKAVIPTAKNVVTTDRASKNLMINISFWPLGKKSGR